MKSHFGFLIIDKPPGLTSHDCVNVIRKVFKIKRVGHGGTLDPSVTGVLPIAIGSATRLFPYLPKSKTYNAIIQLGKITNTDDINGDILSEKKWPEIKKVFLKEFLNQFIGNIKQKPPTISSIHINGERAYKRARKGEKFDIPTRCITIYKLKLINWDKKTGQLKIIIHCSSGTYIRSLARDIGEKLKCGGCLLTLRRIQSQGFNEKESISLNKIGNNLTNLPKLINPLDSLEHLIKIKLETAEELNKWKKGQQLFISKEQIKPAKPQEQTEGIDQFSNSVVLVDSSDVLAGIGEFISPYSVQPKVVFNSYS